MNFTFKPIKNNDGYKSEIFWKNISIGFADSEAIEKSYVDFNKEAYNVLSKHKIIDILNNNINHYMLEIDLDRFDNLNWGDDTVQLWFSNDGYYKMNILYSIIDWNRNINLSTFLAQIKEVLILKNNKITFSDNKYDIKEDGIIFDIKLDIEKDSFSIENILKNFDKEVGQIFQKFDNDIKANSLTTTFTFPPEIQTSCEQYLIYFSQFMKDLGVNVNSDIQVKSKETLFTVTPADSTQALQQIRDSLNVFLGLVEVKDIELYTEEFRDIGVRQLISNIYHLKSQAMLSSSIIEMKQATIDSLNLTNYQLKNLIKQNPSDKKNEEKIIDGLVTVKELDLKGVNINIPEIFRRTKRKIFK